MLLIKYHNNYADEFDVNGFIVMSKEDWETHIKEAEEIFKKQPVKETFRGSGDPRPKAIEIYFGSNESIEYRDFKDYLSSFKVTEITDQEAGFFQKFFRGKHGTILMLEVDDYDDNDAEEDDEEEIDEHGNVIEEDDEEEDNG